MIVGKIGCLKAGGKKMVLRAAVLLVKCPRSGGICSFEIDIEETLPVSGGVFQTIHIAFGKRGAGLKPAFRNKSIFVIFLCADNIPEGEPAPSGIDGPEASFPQGVKLLLPAAPACEEIGKACFDDRARPECFDIPD